MRKKVTLSLQPWELAELDRRARDAGLSRSGYLRWMLCHIMPRADTNPVDPPTQAPEGLEAVEGN